MSSGDPKNRRKHQGKALTLRALKIPATGPKGALKETDKFNWPIVKRQKALPGKGN
jgi:hypothetical protein